MPESIIGEMQSGLKVTVVVPTYNELENIRRLIPQLLELLALLLLGEHRSSPSLHVQADQIDLDACGGPTARERLDPSGQSLCCHGGG